MTLYLVTYESANKYYIDNWILLTSLWYNLNEVESSEKLTNITLASKDVRLRSFLN